MVARGMIVLIIAILIVVICLISMRDFNMDLRKWTLLMIAIFYGVLFGAVFIFSYMGHNTYSNMVYINEYGLFELLMYFISVLVMILGVSFGFKIKTNEKGLINIRNPIFLDDSEKFWHKLLYFSVIMLFVSVGSYFLYARAYGGFIGLLEHTISIRIGLSNISNRWSFLQKFGPFAYISGYSLFSIVINRRCEKKIRYYAFPFWLFALVFSVYVAYSQGGRGTLVNITLIYILTMVFEYSSNLFKIIKKHWKKFSAVPVVFLLMNDLWSRASYNGLTEMIARGYSYLFSSFIVNLENINFRWFVDILQMPLYFLPSSLYSKYGIKTANQFNTFLMNGAYKGDTVNGIIITGESTTGLLTVSYMQLSLIGVFLFSVFIGVCFSKWNRRLKLMKATSFKSMIYAYYVVGFVYSEVGGGDTAAFVISNFAYFIFFFGFSCFYRLRMK